MARSYNQYTGNGVTTQYAISFEYLDEDHVLAKVAGVLTAITFVNPSTVQFAAAPASGAVVRIYRDSSRDDRLVDFEPGTLTEEDLDTDSLQAFYMAQEAIDIADDAMVPDSTDNWDAESKRIKNVADGTGANDAINKSQLDAAALAPVTPIAASIANTPSGNLAATDVQAALNELQGDVDTVNTLKAPLASPTFTGTPAAPTASPGTDTTQLATTAFVQAVGGKWERINTYTPTAVASQSITGFDPAKYSDYRLVIEQLNPATDGVNICLRTSTDGGSSFASSAGNYMWAASQVSGATGSDAGNGGDNTIVLNGSTQGNAANEHFNADVTIVNPGATARCVFYWQTNAINTAGGHLFGVGSGRRDAVADVDAVQLFMSSGNIASATITFYGLRKPS